MEYDFTNCKIDPLKWYGGANGNKIGIEYQNKNYMLKFPPKPTKNTLMSYTNSCISEYVACHIFESIELCTQETILGKYENKITVACKDFEEDGFVFKEFAYLKNTIIDSEQNGYGTELEDIINTINSQQIIEQDVLETFFWDMFIGDALLGNFDRHNGNWGFLVNNKRGIVKIAPIYDCGSCLYPQIEESAMDMVLKNQNEIDDRIYKYPTSAIHQNGKKINYYEFLNTTTNEKCILSLKKISKKINMEKINELIENTPFISDIHKQFLKTMIYKRKKYIIDSANNRH